MRSSLRSDSDFNVNKKKEMPLNHPILKTETKRNISIVHSLQQYRFGAIEIIEWWPSMRHDTNIFGDFMMLRYTENAFERPPGDQVLEVTELLFCCFAVFLLFCQS